MNITTPRQGPLGKLPGILGDIADVAGHEAALRIAWQHGGDDGWDVPARANTEAGAELSMLIGAPAAAEVMRLLGGGAVAVPLARRHVAHWMVARGSSVSEIARTMRVSRRTARRYMKPKDET